MGTSPAKAPFKRRSLFKAAGIGTAGAAGLPLMSACGEVSGGEGNVQELDQTLDILPEYKEWPLPVQPDLVGEPPNHPSAFLTYPDPVAQAIPNPPSNSGEYQIYVPNWGPEPRPRTTRTSSRCRRPRAGPRSSSSRATAKPSPKPPCSGSRPRSSATRSSCSAGAPARTPTSTRPSSTASPTSPTSSPATSPSAGRCWPDAATPPGPTPSGPPTPRTRRPPPASTACPGRSTAAPAPPLLPRRPARHAGLAVPTTVEEAARSGPRLVRRQRRQVGLRRHRLDLHRPGSASPAATDGSGTAPGSSTTTSAPSSRNGSSSSALRPTRSCATPASAPPTSTPDSP